MKKIVPPPQAIKNRLFLDHQYAKDHQEDTNDNADDPDNPLQEQDHLIKIHIHSPASKREQHNPDNQRYYTRFVHTYLLFPYLVLYVYKY